MKRDRRQLVDEIKKAWTLSDIRAATWLLGELRDFIHALIPLMRTAYEEKEKEQGSCTDCRHFAIKNNAMWCIFCPPGYEMKTDTPCGFHMQMEMK